jgi:hypothetical protein
MEASKIWLRNPPGFSSVAAMSDAWYVASDGKQMGPFTGAQLTQFAKEGRIVAGTLLWADGMAEWVKASQVEGLLPVAPSGPARAGAVRPAGNPAARTVTPTKSAMPQPAVVPTKPAIPYATPAAVASTKGAAPYATPAAVAPTKGTAPYATPAASAQMQTPRGAGGGNYPYFPVSPVSYGVWLGLFCSGLLSLVAMTLMAVSINNQIKAEVQPTMTMMIVLFTVLGIGTLFLLSAAIYQLVILARAWYCLRAASPRTTPGMAVGMLFIPFYNLYWIFIAYNSLAADWNRLASRAANLRGAPRMSEGTFLAYCICALLFPPAAMVLCFPIVSQMCKCVNFMASRIGQPTAAR